MTMAGALTKRDTGIFDQKDKTLLPLPGSKQAEGEGKQTKLPHCGQI